MKYLLDTVVFLWSTFNQLEKIPDQVRDLLKRKDIDFLLSTASSWEIAIKHSLHRLPYTEDPIRLIHEGTQSGEILHLPVSYEHALHTATLPFHHKDPFDRLLIAQAQIDKLPIITPDPHFKKYGVEVIW